jgi:hypothetical protein
MKIEKTTFGPWADCYRCTLPAAGGGEAELIAVASIGPRIISLRVNGGANLLFDDSAGGIARGDWRIFGGHRFWISPETETSYYPDCVPCEVTIGNDALRIAAPPETPSGLQKTIEISACPVTGGFRLQHALTNTGAMLAPGAIWCLTCVAPQGRIVVPWGEGSPRHADPAAAWRTHMVRYWRRWANSTTDIESKQWQLRNDYFMVEPTGETGKVGLSSDLGAALLLRPDATFIKLAPPQPGITYPDGGCNIELYTCGSFIEMESLGAFGMLAHGERTTHTESWVVSGQTFQPAAWAEALKLAGG